ncbi:MAG TPA: ThiF family adenylyltransferase [Solirubrobacteraceae bacterium]
MTATERQRLDVQPEEEHDRYHRQTLISWWDQERLRDASVLVVGAGALGNELVKNLVLTGVGRIVVADLDRIENSNLSRCVFFRAGDEGRYKAEVVAERACDLNPDVVVEPIVGDVRLSIGLGTFADVDLVLGGLDNREARLFVNQACWKTSTPFVDGAMEGLMGVVRVFDPPESACYECTMNERDHELIAARRTCALLTRDDLAEGKVPTTATTSGVVAGLQVQEAIKLLHRERLGPPALAGAGFHFVGLTHDSYVVRYPRREECLSHDTYDVEDAEVFSPTAPFRELVAWAERQLGEGTAIELEHEIVVAGECTRCGVREEILRPVPALDAGRGLCFECLEPWRLEFAHAIDRESPLLGLTAVDLDLPPEDVVVARAGADRVFVRLAPVAVDTAGAPA